LSSDAHQALPSGLLEVRQVIASSGSRPGIGRTLGIKGTVAEHGYVVLTGSPTEDHYNPLGSVHGGYVATMLDGAMALAVHTTLEGGTDYATTDLKIAYLRALTTLSGPLRCEGTILNAGKRMILGEARLFDAKDQLCAHATASFMIIARGKR
jgi:uncharacterized protein (TIGR00369 family)